MSNQQKIDERVQREIAKQNKIYGSIDIVYEMIGKCNFPTADLMKVQQAINVIKLQQKVDIMCPSREDCLKNLFEIESGILDKIVEENCSNTELMDNKLES